MSTPWKLSTISINVNGIKTDMWSKLRSVHKLRYDIILMQETKLKDDDANDDLTYRWKQVAEGEAYTSPAISSQEGGVAILLSAHACTLLTNRTIIPTNQNHHRQIILQADLHEHTVFIQSIYAPAHRTDRPQFFTMLKTPPSTANHLIGGDFNCIMDPQLDTTGNCEIATTGTIELTNWITNLGAVDAWRVHNNDRMEFTSPAGTSRIDMIFTSGCFNNYRSASHSPRTIGSDHLCPSLISSSCEITQKKGHWQLPVWLARPASNTFKPILERLSTRTDHPDYPNIFSRAMKEVTGKCQATHKRVIRWRAKKVDRARLRWLRAHTCAIQFPTNESITNAEDARQQWLAEVKERGRRNRAWAFDKHFEEAERCTAFFLRWPKPNGTTVIPGVKLTDGTTTNDHTAIAEAHANFWSTLYSKTSNGMGPAPTPNNISNLTNTITRRIPDAAATALEAEIGEDDIIEHIGRLPNNKAAGADGLRAELLKCAPKLWAKVLKPIFELHLHKSNLLPQLFRESVIVLIHKKGCAYEPPNYRPIALLNVTVKLLSGIHNSRLSKHLDAIVPPEPTGFVPRRSISENITLLHDAIYFAKRHHPTSIILSLDFQKAYDRVQWPVLLAILKTLGFGPRWLTVVSTMYKMRSAKININGELTHSFKLERGVLQGDPMSPALFILQCMPLYQRLNDERHNHGIPLPHGQPAPIATFYADDTNLIAKSPESATSLYNIAEWFCQQSGAKLHPSKCIAIPTGPSPATLPNGIRILNSTEHTTVLGVPMGLNISRQTQTEMIVTKMIQRCNKWAHVGRTIEGKITIARAIILSTVWYVLGALPTNYGEAKLIQRAINSYVEGAESTEWNGTAPRTQMTSEWFYRDPSMGGWGLTPIIHTLKTRKLSMIRNFIRDRQKNITKPWHAFITHMLEEHMESWCTSWEHITLWNCPTSHNQSQTGNWHALSPWWRDTWRQWLHLGCLPRKNSTPRHILKRWPIWNNRILASSHGISTTLHQSFTNSHTRTHMSNIRKLGFRSFQDFMHDDHSIMTGTELYETVTVHLSVLNTDQVIPRWACNDLIRTVRALWANTTRKWLLTTSNPNPPDTTDWWHIACNTKPFTSASNKDITKMIRGSEPPPRTLRLIKLHGTPITICWKRERKALAMLAPSRRDLLLRLTRNALPLGIKRIHWNLNTQTTCMLCDTETIKNRATHILGV